MTKNSFENELMFGMQKELQSYEKKQGVDNLVKAAEYLHAAIEILEEAGLETKADQVLRILGKLAVAQDVNDVAKSKEDADFYDKVMKWLETPAIPVDPNNPQPNEELSFTSVIESDKKSKPSSEDLVFQSIAAELGLIDNQNAKAPNKPRNPTSISDNHTKGLTPEKMLTNLKGHGTMFNMVDDGAADDLLNADLIEEPLEISENDIEKTFEDSD